MATDHIHSAVIYDETRQERSALLLLNASYISRVLRLTLRAPEIIESIFDGWQSVDLTLALLMRPFAVGWREQQMAIGLSLGTSRPD
jgi:hypothetical protein